MWLSRLPLLPIVDPSVPTWVTLAQPSGQLSQTLGRRCNSNGSVSMDARIVGYTLGGGRYTSDRETDSNTERTSELKDQKNTVDKYIDLILCQIALSKGNVQVIFLYSFVSY